MLLSHDELLELIERGVIENAKPDAVNSASIDVHLGDVIMVEDFSSGPQLIDYRAREKPAIADRGGIPPAIRHQRGVQAQVVDGTYWVGALERGMGRRRMAWFSVDITQCQRILIRPGDAIGQMVFFRHKPVPQERSYAARGRYNGDKTVETIKE